jgi:hypothetical protein
MHDEGLKKSAIDQMMGELDDVTADSLRQSPGKPKGPVSGVEIAITVSPKTDEEMKEELEEHGEGGEKCDVEGCEDPMHDHSERDGGEAPEAEGEGSDYISQLLKKLG